MGRSKRIFKKRRNIGKSKVQNLICTSDGKATSNVASSSQTGSSSRKKLGDNISEYNKYDTNFEYTIVDLKKFEVLLQNIAECKFCKNPLVIEKTSIAGLACDIKVSCSHCNENVKSENCDKITIEQDSTEVIFRDLNLRLVYAMRSIGKGHAAAEVFCGIMNFPHPPHTYYKYERYLGSISKDVCGDSMRNAIEEAVVENEGCRDISVAVDGSWQKRGHTSFNGIVSVTSIDTGKVLDVSVLSNFCVCPKKSQMQHKQNCKANYLGTSGGMEVAGAKEIFERSLSLYNVRYLNYLGDGDSRAYQSVVDAQPYGNDFKIKKLECIGHIQKRMGTRLRKLKAKSDKLPDGKSLGGKGRLTETAIQKIQLYYGLAIRRNTGSISEMEKSIWAEYYHLLASNNNPDHRFCPNDENTWCKYNKAKLEGKIYDHTQHTHLPEVVMTHIKPIFRDLANPSLLEKCLEGKTQNPNESLNNKIWSIVPKCTFVSLNTLQFGVYEAVANFNDGYINKCSVFEKIGLEIGRNFVKTMKMLDIRRMKKADKAHEEIQKKIRQSRNLTKKKLEDKYEHLEDPDNPSYSSGMY